MSNDQRPRRRKLLAATIGLATVSYVVGVGCAAPDEDPADTTLSTGQAASEDDRGVTSGNLPAPPPPPKDAGIDQGVTSGNLPAPPPKDGSE